ncbi:hypothetical protein Taro_013670 [Colocasia esculenta]|uniref:ribonuclease P n=1 Tax=Colocasia esculenta TaxID=4460 RepID=A0A843UCR4_COLES|nr:hypothetical protein [Colocasia esculenta]
MAALCSRPLQQEWRLSARPCRHASTCGCEPSSPPRSLAVRASRKKTPLRGACRLSMMVPGSENQVAEKMPQQEQVHVKRAARERTVQGGVAGRGVMMGRTARGVARLVADEDVEKGTGRGHGHASRSVGYKNDICVRPSGFYSLHSRDGCAERKSAKSKGSVMIDTRKGEKSKKKGVALVGERKEKASKKSKVKSPEDRLRIGLDMCSKRGDVMGAISLYDSAVREGVKLDQYHYNVLLYLCASAAGGVIHPAKSGSSNYSSGGASVKDASLGGDFSDGPQIIQLNGDGTALKDSDGSLSGSARMVIRDTSSASSPDKRKADLQGHSFHGPNGSCEMEVILGPRTGSMAEREPENGQLLFLQNTAADGDDPTNRTAGHEIRDECGIQVTEDLKKYALDRGFEIYKKMCLEEILLSEAALTSVGRMAMSMGDGDMAFEIVKKIKNMGLTLRLRSYGPALFAYCNSGNVDKAFEVERHMVDCGISPEEPELQALLSVSIAAGRGEMVYYVLQKLRTNVRQVFPATAELIEAWFKSSSASRVGKKKWDQKLIEAAFENGGGGWHGLGWLGKGKWTVVHAHVDTNGICESCGDKLVTIDLDPMETENFSRSVASIAGKRERSKNFENFQKWLDYYGPFDAVIDAANVGLFSQRRFSLTKVNSVLNGIRQKLPSKKWPLIIVHNKRVYGGKMNDPANVKLVEKWKNADAIYTTPTGSNDDWYWLYAAIKCKSLIVTNDEMRDHVFQILGNDFFPKWKERHQVCMVEILLSTGRIFWYTFDSMMDAPSSLCLLPVPLSSSITEPAKGLEILLESEFAAAEWISFLNMQESKKGHWHIPIAIEHGSEKGRIWLCVTRSGILKEANPKIKLKTRKACTDSPGSSQIKPSASSFTKGKRKNTQDPTQDVLRSLQKSLPADGLKDDTIVFKLEMTEKLCGCVIDFQI